MEADKFDALLNSVENSAWALAMKSLPDILRIADGEIEPDDKPLIIGVFCLFSSVLLKKQEDVEKLEDQFENRSRN